MLEQLCQLTDTIESAASALSTEYDPVHLHALRVAVRRLRSLLKQLPNGRPLEFRKSWGNHFKVTSPARDWDVFLESATEQLPPAEAAEFRKLNQHVVAASRKSVTQLVRSAQWKSHLEDWRAFLHGREQYDEDQGEQAFSLDAALGRACATLATALQLDSNRAWHKFRIAVKEVRYLADTAMQADGPRPELQGLVEYCKSLQTALGHWHDTVTQLRLLKNAPNAAVHSTLQAKIRKRKASRLAHIRQLCADAAEALNCESGLGSDGKTPGSE